MRYLDREPKMGDDVFVEYRARVVQGPDGMNVVKVQHKIDTVFVHVSEMRVIAPEPAVGDVVTVDMDLPSGSIVCRCVTVVAVREDDGTWWMTATGRQRANWHPGAGGVWTIVRIGGTP